MARAAFPEPSAHALDGDAEAAVAQTLLESSILPCRPHRQNAARIEPRAGGALEAELDRDAWRALSLQVGDGATAVPRAVRVFPAR